MPTPVLLSFLFSFLPSGINPIWGWGHDLGLGFEMGFHCSSSYAGEAAALPFFPLFFSIWIDLLSFHFIVHPKSRSRVRVRVFN